MGDISVALAAEHEAPACLALLPDVQGLPAEFLIARRGGELVGAAAVVWRTWSTPGGFPLSIEVLPAERRTGVGRALTAAAAALTTGEAPGLWSYRPLPEDGDAARFLQSCGFVLQRRQHHFLAEVAAMRDYLSPTVDRLRARGRVPADARIAPLSEAPLDEVGWLVSAEFGGGPVRALHNLRSRGAGVARSSRRERSLVALQDGRVAGVLLCRAKDGVVVVDGWVTAPGWRNGWTNLLLIEAAAAHSQRDGFEAFRFHCDETAKHTLSMAEKCAAAEVSRLGLYYYAIAEA